MSIEFKLKHPWRWRIWLLFFPLIICIVLAANVLSHIADGLECICEWCKEHEYVEDN
jgi:hypothetical protein